MKARVAWYALMECVMSDDMRSAAAFVGSIDAGAFWVSLVLGIAGAAYLGGGRTPTPLPRMRRFRLLCAAATAALTVSVISDGVLTSIRLATADESAPYFPVFSILFEISCTVVLIAMIRDLAQRTMFTAALQKM